MPKKVQKTLQDYLSRVKSPRHPQIQSAFNLLSSSKSWFLSACKHPKTPSFALDESHGGCSNKSHNDNNDNNKKDSDAATLADIDRFLYENFKSLYFRDDDEEQVETGNSNNTNTKRVSLSSEEIQFQNEQEAPKLLGPTTNMIESPRLLERPRDLSVSTSFFVKPVLSGSSLLAAEDAATSSPTSTITNNTDSASNNSNDHGHNHHTLPDNCIALLTSTSSPYEDFKRSMQDVVEARCKNRERVIDWEFMEELLFCYLKLNEKKSHKFILNAFVDVVAAMRRNSETAVPRKPRSVRTVRIGR